MQPVVGGPQGQQGGQQQQMNKVEEEVSLESFISILCSGC